MTEYSDEVVDELKKNNEEILASLEKEGLKPADKELLNKASAFINGVVKRVEAHQKKKTFLADKIEVGPYQT